MEIIFVLLRHHSFEKTNMYTAEQKHYAHTVSNAVCHLCDVKKKNVYYPRHGCWKSVKAAPWFMVSVP